MSHRERVLTTLNHQQPDRIPIDFGGFSDTGIVVGAYENLKKHLGIEAKTILADRLDQLVQIDERVLKRFDIDTRRLLPKTPESWKGKSLPNGSIEDVWGVTWGPVEDGHYYPCDYPIKGDSEKSNLEAYQWPDPFGLDDLLGEFEKEAKKFYEESDYAVVMSFPGRLMSLGCYLRGFDNWLIDMVTNETFAEALLDRGLETQLEIGGKWLAAAGDYINVIHISDDLGTQNAPMISPTLYRKLIKPRQRKLFSFIKSRTDAKILLHSDGCVFPFIADFIEVGVDILNPLQVGAKDMHPKMLKQQFGGRLCFWGGIDTQSTLPFGASKDVEEEVSQRIEELGSNGGYVLSGTHNIQNDVPPQNICAMFDAALKCEASFGRSNKRTVGFGERGKK
jgi:uroporphyrinogen decarboxylase